MTTNLQGRAGFRLAFSALVALGLSLAPGASAQDVAPDTETDVSAPLLSAPIPWRLSADQEGVESTWSHAAGLGFQEGFELGLGLNRELEGAWTPGSIMAGVSYRLGPIALGAGSVVLDEGEGDHRRSDVALALRLGRQLSIGVRSEVHTGFESPGASEEDAELRRTAVSTSWRPSRSLSMALGVEDYDREPGEALQPFMTGALSIRPGSERVSFGAEGGWALRGEAPWRVGGALRFMVSPGLELGGYGRYVADSASPERVEWGAFLALTQRGFTAEGSIDRVDPSGDPDASAMGTASLFRWTSRTAPELLSRTGKIWVVNVDGAAPERPSAGLFQSSREGWAHTLLRLNSLAGDDSMAGVHVELHAAPGWAQAWELRRALARLKAAGKHISVRLSWADMRGLYLASVAHKVYGQPTGGVEAGGLAVTRTYLADLLRRMGIEAQFVAIGDYKSAPDGLTRAEPTDADKEQTRALLEDFQGEWFTAVSAGRGLSRERLEASFKRSMKSMAAAHEEGLVDRLVGDHELKGALQEATGGSVHLVHRYERAPESWRPWGGRDTVAVVPILGTIAAGNSDGGLFGSADTQDRPTIKLLDKLRKDRSVAAVVVRVDSPGGGVTASDRIYEAVRRLAEAKTVVVSMGEVAASGGYYVACGAKQIMATPLTVTGSVGIFAGKVHGAALLERYGVGVHTERSAAHADQRSIFRPFDATELESLRLALETSYKRFVGLVARARGLSVEEADARGGGRIYSGSRARKQRLVDAEGSLWDAIQAARRESGAGGDARVVYAKAPRDASDVLSTVNVGLGATPWPAWLSSIESWWSSVHSLNSRPMQARLPFMIEIQ